MHLGNVFGSSMRSTLRSPSLQRNVFRQGRNMRIAPQPEVYSKYVPMPKTEMPMAMRQGNGKTLMKNGNGAQAQTTQARKALAFQQLKNTVVERIQQTFAQKQTSGQMVPMRQPEFPSRKITAKSPYQNIMAKTARF